MEQDSTLSRRRIEFFVKWGSIAVSLVVLYLLAFTYLIDKRPFVEWTLIKANPNEARAESQLIKLPDGKVFLLNGRRVYRSLRS